MKHILSYTVCLLLAFSAAAAKRVTWVIDAGHGGHDVGCESRSTNEKAITLAVAKELGQLIKKNINGVRVVYTREKDTYLTLQERCDVANARGAALFISIHVNSAANQFARGTETFFATNVPLKGTQSGKSELLALLLQKQYLQHGREVSRGVKQRELYVCEHTNMPSVLTEIGFISNLNEETYLMSKTGQQELAQAICQALAEWKEMTKNGTVQKRDLQNLRYTHYAPITMVQAPRARKGECEVTVKEEKKKEEKKEEEKKEDKKTEKTEQTETAAPEPAQQEQAPYFCIQLMNTATKLKEGDYRLKGFKGVRYVDANGRFKVLYGHSENYREVKNQLVEVRETFPEAFIVAFLGETQITTAEALERLKK